MGVNEYDLCCLCTHYYEVHISEFSQASTNYMSPYDRQNNCTLQTIVSSIANGQQHMTLLSLMTQLFLTQTFS